MVYAYDLSIFDLCPLGASIRNGVATGSLPLCYEHRREHERLRARAAVV